MQKHAAETASLTRAHERNRCISEMSSTTAIPTLLRYSQAGFSKKSSSLVQIDRLGRSLLDLITMLDDLRSRGVKFHSLTGRSAQPRPRAAQCGR